MTLDPFDEEGSASVELAVLTPVVLLVLVLMVAGGRIVTAHTALEHAATAAARAASLARTPTAAHAAAVGTGTRVLGDQHLPCTDIQHTLDTSGFGTRPGQAGVVTIRVRCTVTLSDLTSLPGLPGTVGLDAASSSPVDPYRTRS
ncbi:TadE/TadG family type IV pilus assembly protein [Saccharopolyspora sp. ASAGF58]|uniref:TadE/TadG family type IV pilus assembly protein n=1 Tax=Saccharopolyspora sp. ASAGF58 TaxID=2719023 RepID=UPI0014402A09|nr:TadE/TadG family type IV pilus assembly protein [Saccharopolyspora sp. ASAGF58]QIZ37900.1 pilus assembly protein TadE [Saccharopolyspora sp. ASAGF58]